MNSFIKGIRSFLKSEQAQKAKLLRILLLLIKYSILVNCVPLKYYFNRYFGNKYPEDQGDLQPFVKEIGYLIRIGMLLPWQVTCLIESLAIKEYFRIYGINLNIKLGVITSEGIHAHAWCLPQRRNNYIEIDY